MSARLAVLAGIDPTGGAGLALDLRIAHRLGLSPAIAPTCLTVQDRSGFVAATAVDPGVLIAMLRAIRREGLPHAVKLGLCADAATVAVIASWYAELSAPRPPLVVDPVLSATAGGGPREAAAIARALVGELVPLGAILTPNLPELAALTGMGPEDGAAALLARGAEAVLVKGGHADGDLAIDVLHLRMTRREFAHARLRRGPVHGTGCALASGIAARLALGVELTAAVRDAIDDVVRWIADTLDSGDGLPDAIAVGAREAQPSPSVPWPPNSSSMSGR